MPEAICSLCRRVKVDGDCLNCLRQDKRSFQLMARNMAALIPKGAPGIMDWGRAGGETICLKCGLAYIEHPLGMEPYLHLLCDGKQVKL